MTGTAGPRRGRNVRPSSSPHVGPEQESAPPKPSAADSASDASAPPDGEPAVRGSDLARDALAAARARNAAARDQAGVRRVGRIPQTGGRGAVAGRMSRRRWSGPGLDKARDPQPIGETVRGWLKASGAGRELAKASLIARWAQIVGPAIADHCRPVSLVDGELLLQAESTAWATQLRMIAPTIVARINAEVGRGTVSRIRATGPAGPSWRFGNRHVSGRGPRDTYG